MKTILLISCVLTVLMAATGCGGPEWTPAPEALAEPEPIETVTLGANREFVVNGRPFFPIGSWAQDNHRYPLLRSVGINTFVGGGEGLASNLKAAEAAGGYHVSGFSAEAIGQPYLLGWIHSDEPDLLRAVQDIELTAEAMRPHNRSRLGRMFDGNVDSKGYLEPLTGLEITARWPKAATVVTFRLKQGGSNVKIRTLDILSDGEPLISTMLADSGDWQEIVLAEAATFEALTIRVATVYGGEGDEGLCYEFEGLDAAGANVLAAPRRREPRFAPEQVMEKYLQIRGADQSRPVMMTLTSRFMKGETPQPESVTESYRRYAAGTDVVGFDMYPIYGHNRPEWITHPGKGVAELRELAGPTKPVYAFIETSKGSRWITYSLQHDVLPEHTRAEVWMTIIKGATGIIYFTHAWRPEFTEFAPTDAMRAELTRLNGQITRLAGPILSAPAATKIEMALSDGLDGHFKATRHNGDLWIFAQSLDIDGKAATATFRVEGLDAGTTIEVVDEDRTIVAGDGAFTDTIDALAEHVYRIAR